MMLHNLSSLTLILLTVFYSGGTLTQTEPNIEPIRIKLALEQCDVHQAMKEIANMLSQLGVIQNSAEDYFTIFRVLFKSANLKFKPQRGVNMKVSLENATFIFELLLNGTAEEALSRLEVYKIVDGDCRDVFCVGINFQRVDADRLVLSWAVNLYSGNGTLIKSFPRESENVMYWRNRTQSTDPLRREPSMMRREPVRDYYDILEEVGKGRHGVVYRCVEKKTGKVFAARFLQAWIHSLREDIYEEVNIMNKLSQPGHPNLLTLHEVFDNDADIIQIVDFLEKLSHFWTFAPVVHRIIGQICEGLQYMHARNIVHMDVRSCNVMLVPNTSGRRVKLVDFGVAQEADKIRLAREVNCEDSLHFHDYNTPEELQNRSMGIYTDMWYLGVTTYYILTGQYPHWGNECDEIDEKIKKGRWKYMRNDARLSRKSLDFIGKLLVPDIKKRMTAEQCLSDPWILDG